MISLSADTAPSGDGHLCQSQYFTQPSPTSYGGSITSAPSLQLATWTPDADTLSNLLERALGLNPTVTNLPAEQPTLALDGAFLSLAYTRSLNAADLIIGAMWSDDLAGRSNAEWPG